MARRSTGTGDLQGRRGATRRWRRNNRRRWNRLLSRILGTTTAKQRPLAVDTRHVLVVRINQRLGNILFLTPMLRSLVTGLPGAAIDVIVRDSAHTALLQSLPGVRRVWILHKSVIHIIGLLYRVRAQRYDLVIDPIGNSASNRLAVALSKGRQRLGFAFDDQWLPLTHASARPHSRHQALQAVEMIRGAVSRPRFAYIDTLAVYPDQSARTAAADRWRRLFADRPSHGPTVGFFTQATGEKQFARGWWQDWLAAVRAKAPAASLVQIRAPGVDALDPTVSHVAIAALDELAAFMACFDVFVAADSGPMHLAAASGIPVIGLFRATSPAAYAPLGYRCLCLAGSDLAAAAVADTVRDVLGQREPVSAATIRSRSMRR